MAEQDIPNLIADLKITVVQGHIRQIIEHSTVMGELKVLSYLKEKIDEIHTEATKHKNTEMLEMMGLDTIAAIHEKFQEAKEDNKVIWKDYLWTGLIGTFLLVLIPALALFFKGQIIDAWRSLQTYRPGGDNSPEARNARTILTNNGNGGLGRETLGAVNQRELRNWNGGTSLADLVGNPANAQQAETLAKALEKLNPQVERFDAKAPGFLNSFKKLPNESKAAKAVTILQTVGDAIKKVNARKLLKIAEALEKLNSELDKFQPTKLPKEADIAGTATAMNNLANETGTLRSKFQDLTGTIRSLDQQIAGATS